MNINYKGREFMIIIACVDDDFGMQFNKRRQSKDSKLIKRIYEITEGKRLFVKEFSKDLFEKDKIIVTDSFISSVKEDDFIFIEDTKYLDFSKVSKIILFFWGRVYPSDIKFNMPTGFKPITTNEFSGNSHEKITEVIYEKN